MFYQTFSPIYILKSSVLLHFCRSGLTDQRFSGSLTEVRFSLQKKHNFCYTMKQTYFICTKLTKMHINIIFSKLKPKTVSQIFYDEEKGPLCLSCGQDNVVVIFTCTQTWNFCMKITQRCK